MAVVDMSTRNNRVVPGKQVNVFECQRCRAQFPASTVENALEREQKRLYIHEGDLFHRCNDLDRLSIEQAHSTLHHHVHRANEWRHLREHVEERHSQDGVPAPVRDALQSVQADLERLEHKEHERIAQARRAVTEVEAFVAYPDD